MPPEHGAGLTVARRGFDYCSEDSAGRPAARGPEPGRRVSGIAGIVVPESESPGKQPENTGVEPKSAGFGR